eukprot:4365680-Prymnesium_polylepis.1
MRRVQGTLRPAGVRAQASHPPKNIAWSLTGPYHRPVSSQEHPPQASLWLVCVLVPSKFRRR